MALVNTNLWMPGPPFFEGVVPALSGAALLDAVADRYAAVFYPPKLGNIRKVGFLTGTVPILGGTTTLVMSLQDVSLTTGNPDDTDDQTATIANGSIVANTMILSGALSADRVVSDLSIPIAAVVKYGTFNSGDQVNFTEFFMTTREGPNSDEYGAGSLSGAYAKRGNMPVIEIEYDDGSHAYSPFLAHPFSALGTDTYNNTSTPDEIGLRFQVPFAGRLAGCWVNMDRDGDINLNLYNASTKTTVRAVDKDVRVGTSHATSVLAFVTPVVLVADTTYILAVEPSSATSVVLMNHSVRAAVALDQMVGGQAWHYATAKDPATTADFTMTTTKRPFMGLMFDQVDNGAGGGGSGLLKLRP